MSPGKESCAYHRHERNEEVLLILSGQGRAEIGDEVIDVGAADVMGFAAPDGPPNHLTNPFQEHLVYVMGGESSAFDVAHFPKIGKRLVFSDTDISLIDGQASKAMSFADWLVDRSSGDQGIQALSG
ncbi:MAG: cupin domain-containing protein [Rhodobacteraceae bacterium]|nr:cupin domain-containing protein [Paracoccaceae bacterium]